MELKNGNAAFKMTAENLQTAQANLLVDIYAYITTLSEMMINLHAKTDEQFKSLTDKFEATVLLKREQILSNQYKNYGSVDIGDIVE